MNFAHFSQKHYLLNTFTWLFLLIPPFQPRFYHTFMITLFLSFPSCFSFYYWHSWEEDSSYPFLIHAPLDSACLPLFTLRSFLFHILLRCFRQFPLTLTQQNFLGLNKCQKGDFASSTVIFYQKSIFNFLNPFTNRLSSFMGYSQVRF